MPRFTFSKQTPIAACAKDVFDWHRRPGAFNRLSPPWETIQVLSQGTDVTDGQQVSLRLMLGPLPMRWDLVHQHFILDQQFEDRQVSGPFAHWVHTHRVEPVDATNCVLVDHIEYNLPIAPFGDLLGGLLVRDMLQRLFTYRHAITAADLATYQHYKGDSPMRILVTGASGMVGTALVSFLRTQGHLVFELTRQPAKTKFQLQWDPTAGTLDLSSIAPLDAVVNLAGDNIAQGRWTAEKKQKIKTSRLQATTLLCQTLATMAQAPKVLVSASAIGYYGSCGDAVLDESAAPGNDFLADVAQEWEHATQVASDKGIRVVLTRFGVILSPQGGALKQMLPPFQLGAGGPMGNGRQYMSWIALDDVVGAIYHAIQTDALHGPVNVVSPNPVRNSQFTGALGCVLFRPAFAPVPGFAVRLLFGEMGDALLLASQNVHPTQLQSTGYTFLYPEIKGALAHLLGK